MLKMNLADSFKPAVFLLFFSFTAIGLNIQPNFAFAEKVENPEAGIVAYVVDRDHTRIDFEVAHLVFSSVHGQFNEFSGELYFDEKNLADTQLKAQVKAESVFTGQEKRDQHLRSADFFDAKKYPEILFESKRVEKKGTKNFRLIGNLTLHGITKEIGFDFSYLGKVNAYSKERVGFKAETKITRQDFAMNFSTLADSVPLVGDEVTIRVTLQAIRKSDL